MNLIKLNNKFEIPQIGIGTYKVEKQEDINLLIENAYKYGYRMLDTASFFNNEKLIGNYFKENPSIVDNLVISTKIWPIDYDKDKAKKSIENSLKNMGIDIIDIMILHWPSEGFEQVWKILEQYYEQGIFKAIAVSNFHKNHLEKLFVNANIVPVFNQVELHPYLSQKELSNYLNSINIKVEAWAPLGKGNENLFSESILLDLAKKYDKTIAQIILRWHIENNNIIIPKSVSLTRIQENINIYDFKLTSNEIKIIDSLNKNLRFSQNPDNKQWLNKIRYGEL